MTINDRRCALRVLVSDGMADVTFDATDPTGLVIGSLSGTIAIEDLVPVTRTIAMTLGSVAKALGLTSMRSSVDLDEARKSHPRAGMPWSADEDKRLLQRYQDGATLLKLSDEFERNIGGIASRLKLHGFRLPSRRDRDDGPNLDYADISEPDTDWP